MVNISGGFCGCKGCVVGLRGWLVFIISFGGCWKCVIFNVMFSGCDKSLGFNIWFCGC